MKSLLVAALLFAAQLLAPLPNVAVAGAPAQGPRYTAEQAKAEFDRLNGNWQVFSAAFQFGGEMIYRFNAGKVTIETRPVKSKTDNSIESETIEHHRYRIDLSQEPKRLFLISDKPGSKEASYIYEFRDGQLWMSPVLTGNANNAASLRYGQGQSGWLMGLNPIK